jgi:hypothetical protein
MQVLEYLEKSKVKYEVKGHSFEEALASPWPLIFVLAVQKVVTGRTPHSGA